MKHFSILFVCILYLNISFAQQDEFWGTTAFGGSGDAGVIFSMKTDGTGYTVRHNFQVDKPGIGPLYAPALFNDTYYGVTEFGGKYGEGILYAYEKTTQVYTVLHEFKIEEGYRPYSNVVVINNKLYGTTYEYNGGNTKPGVIYEYDLTTNIYTVKKIFTNYTGAVLGANPAGSLAVYNNKIYGSTLQGGSGLAGSIYEYDPATNIFRSLYGFGYVSGSYPNGASPNGSLSLYNNALYGTTSNGGINNSGVVFKYDLLTNTFTKLANFGGTGNGSSPADGMTLVNGVFYGVTQFGGTSGGGTIYSFDPANNTITYLQQFAFGGPYGSNPRFKLTYFNNLLYGSGQNSGTYAANIFAFNPVTNTITSEYSSSVPGESFTGDFLIDNNKFVTVTAQLINSTISFDPVAKTKSTVFLFNTIPFGGMPNRSLLYDNNIFYGSTSTGGTNGRGVVFSFNPVGNVYTVLYNLTTNAFTLGDFTKMGNKLYAPAGDGYYNNSSSQDFGAVFYLDLTANTAGSVSAYPTTVGSTPTGVMIPTDNPNELLVLTSSGSGTYAGGALTKFNTNTNTFITPPTTYYGSGTFPAYTSKTSDGRVFVATQYAGAFNQGSLHLQSVGTKTSFKSSTTGRGPDGAIAELNGKYYITTRYDGPVNANTGTMVEIDPANMTTPTLKLSFVPTGGTDHRGNLVIDNGKLFGVMYSGGAIYTNSTSEQVYYNRGTIFQYDPVANTYTKLYDFNAAEGKNPTSLIKAPTAVVILPLRFIAFAAQKCNNNQVCLGWQTANEINVSHFDIQRSIDGNTFTKVGQATAKNKPANDYTVTDDISALPTYTKLYYRIKQIDNDGKFSFTDIKAVNNDNQNIPAIFPNPVNNVLHLTNAELIKSVQLSDIRGSKLKTITTDFTAIAINNLPAGIYIVNIILKSGRILQQRIMKQ